MGLKQLLIDADSSQFIQSTGKPFEQRDIPYGEKVINYFKILPLP
jgi:hypothetical protein